MNTDKLHAEVIRTRGVYERLLQAVPSKPYSTWTPEDLDAYRQYQVAFDAHKVATKAWRSACRKKD